MSTDTARDEAGEHGVPVKIPASLKVGDPNIPQILANLVAAETERLTAEHVAAQEAHA